jgi:hypothetical protein
VPAAILRLCGDRLAPPPHFVLTRGILEAYWQDRPWRETLLAKRFQKKHQLGPTASIV